MALQYCEECEKQIDLDSDVDHFDEHKGGSMKIEEIKTTPRQHGKNTAAYQQFFLEGKDKAVVFKTPEGDFMSPKAIQSLLNEQLDEVIKIVANKRVTFVDIKGIDQGVAEMVKHIFNETTDGIISNLKELKNE